MVARSLVFLFCLALLSGCASLPPVADDIAQARAADNDNAQTHLEQLRQQGERIVGRPFVSGNKITIMRDGPALTAMLDAISHARHRIDMESFTFDEKEGGRFADVLLKRRAVGVEVNLIYDAIGSDDTSIELFDHMRARGIHVLEYNPVDPASVLDTSFNHRDHRKLLIIDGHIAFTGGINVSVVYKFKNKVKRFFGKEQEDPDHSPWRDTQIKIEGPAVGEFEHLFTDMWGMKEGEPPLDPLPPPPKAGDLLVQAIDETPDLDRHAAYRSLLVAIATAHTSVHLTAAFFVPTPDLNAALQDAAQRGVDVTVILPSYSDSDLALKASHAYYEDLMEAGVRIYELQAAVLHAKTAVIDGDWSMVGSSNLDWRSVLWNDECNAVILGAAFGRNMERMFASDLAQSKRIDPGEWRNRSFLEVLDEWKARLVEPLL